MYIEKKIAHYIIKPQFFARPKNFIKNQAVLAITEKDV